VLAFAGIPEFLGNLAQTQIVQDDVTQQWNAFFEAWWDRFEGDDITADDLCRLILPPKDLFSKPTDEPLLVAIPEPFLVNRDRGEGSLKRSIGRHLSRLTGRIFSGRKLCDAGADSHKHIRKWRLEQLNADRPSPVSGGAS
jgi:hypothetical protein